MSESQSADGSAGGRGGRRRRIVIIAVWIAAAVLAVLAFRAERRVRNDPAFCASSCHHASEPAAGSAAAGWHATGHAGIACQTCHATSTKVGLKLYWESLSGSAHPTAHGKASAQACTSCHEKSPAEWRVVAETRGHREHHDVKKVDCLSCHSSHKEQPAGQRCLDCHKDEKLHKASTVGAETCLSCHSFAASQKNATEPTTVACERCHSSTEKLTASAGAGQVPPLKDVNNHVIHGGVACQLCHNAHGKKLRAPEGQPVCATCHQFEMFQAGTETRKGPEGHRDCEGCHKPHSPLKSTIRVCVDCHEKNAKGLVGGPKLSTATQVGNAAALVGATAPKGGTTALKHTSCASCHLPHTWKAERSGCMQCHKDKASLLLTRSPPQHNACTNCHEVHGGPPTGAVCLKCHSNTKGRHVALAPEKHKDCTSCHNPHAPLPQDTRGSCAKCHATEVTQITRDGPEGHAKDSCFSCHKPHENPLPPANICAKCHAERAAVVATAAPPKHRVCTSCHERHKFKITDPKAACSKCHAPMFEAATAAAAAAGVAKTPHQGDCKKCHTLHGSPGVPKANCLKCHEKVSAEFHPPNEKHADCRSCHKPHQPAAAARAACATCHDAKAAVATKWPPSSAHAKACNSCHQQHDVRQKKTCDNCHAPEAASAMGSKHQCMQCHPPHQAPPGTGSAWWSRCNACHAAKVESVKQRGPTHSQCKNCHQTHRFAIPSCTSCHRDMPSKGLHSVPQHAASCKACHDPHVASVPRPAQCLACHTDRKNHEPTAEKCQGCHTFK
jgi:hypothetical protein